MPSRTVARHLFKENKGVWLSIEGARLAVLYHRGRTKGNGRKTFIKNPIVSNCPTKAHRADIFVPPSDAEAFLPHVVEIGKGVLAAALGDIHFPYHDQQAVQSAVNHIRKIGANLIILNGDTLDFHRVSRFNKDPRARNVKSEIEMAREFLDWIDELFPKARKIWKDGNHDERYSHYHSQNSPETFEIIQEMAGLDKLLELEDRGWEYVTGKRPIYLGNFTLIHGHEFQTPVIGPVNAARGLFLKAKRSSGVHHHHQVSEHGEPDIRFTQQACWSFGCLCDLHPQYMPFNKWAHGYGEIEVEPSGQFEVRNHKIINGRVV